MISALVGAIAAVCPILGVSVGDWTNKATWRIDFDPAATAPQIAAAQAAMQAFDPVAQQSADNSRITGLQGDTNYQALIAQIQASTVAQIDTWITNNVTTLAQARTVLAAVIKLLAISIAE